MKNDTYELKYTGAHDIIVLAKGFHGPVSPGDTIAVFRESYDEMKGRNDWKIVKVKKEKTGVKKS